MIIDPLPQNPTPPLHSEFGGIQHMTVSLVNDKLNLLDLKP